MSPERRAACGREGGQKAQQSGTARRWTAEEAASWAEVGGDANAETNGSKHMAEIGAKGGKATANRLRKQ